MSKFKVYLPKGEEPVMREQHMGFKFMYVRSECRFKVWDELLTDLFCMNEAARLLRNSQSLLVSGNLLSCLWRFRCSRHIKMDLSHQPLSNKWIVAPLTFSPPSLRSISPPSIPGFTGLLTKALFKWLQHMDAHMP